MRLVNSGIYVFRGDLLWKHIGEIVPNNPAHEYYLTDMAEILTRAGSFVRPFEVADPREIVGHQQRVIELAEVDRFLRDRKVRQLMTDGVTIERPETVTIDGGVTIGVDTVVQAFAHITGKTAIGEDCTIGACSVIADSNHRRRRDHPALHAHGDGHGGCRAPRWDRLPGCA